MNYCYGKGVNNCVLSWEVVPISEGPLLEVPLYYYANTLVLSCYQMKSSAVSCATR